MWRVEVSETSDESAKPGQLFRRGDCIVDGVCYFNQAFLLAAVPSLRARDCSPSEKEALNYLFVLIPVINVLIPVFWKSFAGVFTADCIAMVAMYAWKVRSRPLVSSPFGYKCTQSRALKLAPKMLF